MLHAPVRKRSTKPMLEILEERAVPAVFTVDDDGAQKPNADFTTIQEAIDAAGTWDVIRVYDGTYSEAPNVPSSKTGLRLIGKGDNVDIVAPAGLNGPIVNFDGVKFAFFKNFNVDGNGNAAGTILAGINVENNASVTIRDNSVTGMFNGSLSLEGQGIRVGDADTAGNTLTTGFALIINNDVSNYLKSGILVEGDGSAALVYGNNVTGEGFTNVVVQNGIEVGDGAIAHVRWNTVTNNDFDGDFTATGILVEETDYSLVSANDISFNQTGIFVELSSNITVLHNEVYENFQDGILLTDSDNNFILRNASYRNGSPTIENVTTTVNFDAKANSTAFNAGDVLTSELAGFGIINVEAIGGSGDAMIFDTNNPTGGDTDLAFADQGNALIISEDGVTTNPDDNASGGDLKFDFISGVTLDSLTLLDIDLSESAKVKTFDKYGNLISETDVTPAGDNQAQEVTIGDANVHSVVVWLSGSGAVSDLTFTREEVTSGLEEGLGSGITLFDSSYNVIRNNDNSLNGLDGITVIGSVTATDSNGKTTSSTAEGNIIKWDDSFGNGVDGIFLQDTLATEVLFNDLVMNGGNGLTLINADDTTIKFNDFIANAGFGIEIDADSEGVIEEENLFLENGLGGTGLEFASAALSQDYADTESDDPLGTDVTDLETDYIDQE